MQIIHILFIGSLFFSGMVQATEPAPVQEAESPVVETVPPVTSEEKTTTTSGQELHDAHCVSCHTSMNPDDHTTLYTREKRLVTNYNSLRTQVQRCVTNLDLMWFEEDVISVTDYLNKEFYKFEVEKTQEK